MERSRYGKSLACFLLLCAAAAAPSACVKLPRRPAASPATNVARAEPETSAPRVNINRASPTELERLPGIGPGLAARIVEHRERHGPFRRPEHLLAVRGISERRFRQLRHLINAE